mmetsp:Transcript_9738/g.19457  ORF Transcript_9738/g.19457 Transcript_9738/m.19457 type:complete len:385 (+) Transcript_9738:661-1815(+)
MFGLYWPLQLPRTSQSCAPWPNHKLPTTSYSFRRLPQQRIPYILLENQPTCHVFKDKSLLVNIQPVPHLIAIHSTARTSYADMVGCFRNFLDPVWICESGIANNLSFAKVHVAGCDIKYNQEVDAFVVREPTRSIIFNCLPSRLYGHWVRSAVVCLIDKVDSIAIVYAPRQVVAAKSARHAMSMMGSPSSDTFKLMMRNNLVKNCPLTLESIKIADNVFGPDVAPLQGKMAQQKPDRVDPVYVDIPLEILTCNLDVVVVADLMFVNGLPSLVSISHHITLIAVSYMPSQTSADLCKGMLQIVSVYCCRGLTVTTAMVDNQFNPLRCLIGDVDLNVTAASEHAPEIKQCKRLIKECVCAQKCCVPFSQLPTRVVIGRVSSCVFLD